MGWVASPLRVFSIFPSDVLTSIAVDQKDSRDACGTCLGKCTIDILLWLASALSKRKML